MGVTWSSGRDRAWNHADRQAFRDGVRLRASTVPRKHKPDPSPSEWADDDDNEETEQ